MHISEQSDESVFLLLENFYFVFFHQILCGAFGRQMSYLWLALSFARVGPEWPSLQGQLIPATKFGSLGFPLGDH